MSDYPIVRAAAVQISPDLESLSGTLHKVLNMIDEAAESGVELIVFPETFLPYYPYFSFVLPPVSQGPEHLRLYQEAVVVPSDTTRAIAN
ncbi:MAG: nitrilase-related carbon-nitrogen hydrolase, partial [Marinomonas sp.]